MNATDLFELLLVFVAAAGVVIPVATVLTMPKGARYRVPMFVSAAVALGLWGSVWHWDEITALGSLYFLLLITACAAWWVLRLPFLRVGYGWAAATSCLTAFLAPAVLHLLDRLGTDGRLVHEHSPGWLLWWVPVSLVAFPAALGLLAALRALTRAVRDTVGSRDEDARSVTGGPSAEERRLIVGMLEAGKVSGTEAAALLSSLGEGHSPPADRLPLDGALRCTVMGALLVTVGFVLPWAFIRAGGSVGALSGLPEIRGYQAGYHVGGIGWLILTLGALPAVLGCLAGLDAAIRQGLLRLVISAMGLALAAPLCFAHPVNIGLWAVVAGFLLQLLSAVFQSRVAGEPSPA